jgi:soluble lytic murein transglycosylase
MPYDSNRIRRKPQVTTHTRKWVKALAIGALGVALAMMVNSLALADIYLYVDAQGVMHFTNAPTSAKYRVFMRETVRKPKKWRAEKAHSDRSFDDVIAEAAERNGISFHLLKAMIHVESYFNPRAVSKKGAVGLMQIMPQNFDFLNVSDPFDPWDNIMGGARYFKNMLNRFQGNLDLALAAYNAGPGAVERYNDIPPYQETQDYVQKVRQFFQLYKNS